MSPVLRPARLRADHAHPGRIVLGDASLPARAHACAGNSDMAQVAVLDGLAVPAPHQIHAWARALGELGFSSLRTGALGPRQAAQAEAAGLRCVQELALLELRAPLPTGRAASPTRPAAPRRSTPSTRRARRGDLAAMADVDRAAFGDTWWLDAEMLDEVCVATPRHRARVHGRRAHHVDGFLISGRAGRTGYVQRLAVHPLAQRHGVATALVDDSLRWMRRMQLQRAYVNTHVDNHAALALYHAHGFTELPERLRVFEGPTIR